ncbi:MAG: D-2-hydroxyacid dehydrogenase [Thermomicrobiales bacterium]
MSSDRANVLIAVPISADRLAAIRASAPGCTIDCIEPFPRNTTLPVELIRDRTVLFADFPPVNLAEMARLDWIQLGSAGYMQLAGLPLEAMGVRVTNASGVNDVPIAEWCLLMMLAFERALPELLRVQQERGWDRRAKFQAELHGRRVGIIGYGNIGREVARVCRALDLEVWAMNRGPVGPTPLKYAPTGTGDPRGELPHRCFTLDQMEQFLPHLDYLVMTAALNPATRGLLGERELRLLPPRAVILNPARAHLIDEAGLHRALREGWIAGAALDSHYREPLVTDDPTWALPNVVLTPHISGSTLSPHYLTRLWELFARNLERYITDQPLLNQVSWTELSAS